MAIEKGSFKTSNEKTSTVNQAFQLADDRSCILVTGFENAYGLFGSSSAASFARIAAIRSAALPSQSSGQLPCL